MEYGNYFEYRQVDPSSYNGFVAPRYLRTALGEPRGSLILDFGCGFGQLALALREIGYSVEGLDIAPAAISHCRSLGLICYDGSDPKFFYSHANAYDFVILSHVIEHLPKTEIIPTLARVRELLKPGGAAIVMVPNAQSNTGAYWAYEDFTHSTLFTSGSLYYVLRAAGFGSVEFLDSNSLEGIPFIKRLIKRFLLALYTWNYKFWNRVTSSSIHAPSPMIFGYEVRAIARR